MFKDFKPCVYKKKTLRATEYVCGKKNGIILGFWLFNLKENNYKYYKIMYGRLVLIPND